MHSGQVSGVLNKESNQDKDEATGDQTQQQASYGVIQKRDSEVKTSAETERMDPEPVTHREGDIGPTLGNKECIFTSFNLK